MELLVKCIACENGVMSVTGENTEYLVCNSCGEQHLLLSERYKNLIQQKVGDDA